MLRGENLRPGGLERSAPGPTLDTTAPSSPAGRDRAVPAHDRRRCPRARCRDRSDDESGADAAVEEQDAVDPDDGIEAAQGRSVWPLRSERPNHLDHAERRVAHELLACGGGRRLDELLALGLRIGGRERGTRRESRTGSRPASARFMVAQQAVNAAAGRRRFSFEPPKQVERFAESGPRSTTPQLDELGASARPAD